MAPTSNERGTIDPALEGQAGLRVFLNYRREETSGHAGRLFDDLAERLEGAEVFMDIDRIAPGVDFTEVIDEALDACDVVLALIGRRWSDLADAGGRRRLDVEDDFVRLELEKALGRSDVRVIPVLVHGASMPPSSELPDGLRSLARRQAFELSDTRWHYDLNMLVHALDRVSRLKVEQAVAEAEAAAAAERARLEQERLESQRLASERLEAERLQSERLEAERQEAERLEAERIETERLEAERARVEAQRLEAERLEAERLEAERREAEQLGARRQEAERLVAERVEGERREAERAARPAPERRHAPERSTLPKRTRILALAGGVAALVIGAIGLVAITGGNGAEPRAAPGAKADRLGVLAPPYSVPLRVLLKNDEGDGLKVVGVAGGSGLHGALRLEENNVRYRPDRGYDGPFRFTYTVKDADGDLGVATVTGRVKGLGSVQKDLVALVPPASRDSCVAGRSSAEIRCDVPVGELVVRRYATTRAAEAALAMRFRGAEGTCDSAAATGQWNWPGSSARRGRFGCSTSGGRPTFGWTYPSPARPGAVATVTARRGMALKQLSAWFFERARLPKPS